MKVLAGRLMDADRKILFESNRTGRRVLVAALEAVVTYDQRKPTPYRKAPMSAVGTVTTWDHDTFEVGGWSFTTRISWINAIKVWWRDQAPDEQHVQALLAEFPDAHIEPTP